MEQRKSGQVPEFRYVAGQKLEVTEEMRKAYAEDGFILVRGLLTAAEIEKLEFCIKLGHLTKHSFMLKDRTGTVTKMVIWNHPGNDYTGLIGRCRRVVDTTEELLGGEVYHYHTKINLKEKETGGIFEWHQDYGYWYKNGILRPDLLSVMIAIDKCDKASGCLKVLRGSHKLGRIDHVQAGGQNGADEERLAEAKKVLEEFYVELDPGDALFFHCNVLHSSDQNRSKHSRWVMIPCYNRMDNDPYFDHHHARATKLFKVDDEALMKCEEFADVSGKWFMDPAIDKTIIAKKVHEEVKSSIEIAPKYAEAKS